MAGYRLKSACISISDKDITSLNNRGVISIPHHNELVRTADRKRALEVAQSIKVPDDQRLLHVIPRYYTLDGQRNIKDPVGMQGFRLHVDTHVITAPVLSIQNLNRCIMSLGISIDGLVFKSLASAEAVLTEAERQNGVMLIDIGGATTDVAVFKDDSVFGTATLPVGGHHVTNDIAMGLGLKHDIAEEIKKKCGSIMPPGESGADEVAIAENGHSVSYTDLREVIEARIDELFRLVLLQMPLTDHSKAIPSGMVLTGGSCNLAGIAQRGQEITQLPVRVGLPHSPNGGDDMLSDPAYATGVGLLYWKMKNQNSQNCYTKTGSLRALLPRSLAYFGSRI
jgi:cell division protein FtsA